MTTLATSANSANSGTTGTLAVATGDGDMFRAGDFLAIPKASGLSEVCSVISVATDTLTVNRHVGSSASSTTAAAGAQVIHLGKPQAQGADLDTAALRSNSTSAFNYTEIFRQPVVLTGTAANLDRFDSGETPREVREVMTALALHRRLIEQSLFWGARKLDTSGAQPVGSMGGVSEYMQNASTNNLVFIGGALSLSAFDAAVDDAFARGSGNKVIFAGPLAARALTNVFGANYRPAEFGQKVYGAPVSAFINSQYGLLPLFTKREWGPAPSATHTAANRIFLIDLSEVALRPPKNRYMKFRKAVKATPGQDREAYEFLTEVSLEFANPDAHAVLSGITG